jgi:hypothetical protein
MKPGHSGGGLKDSARKQRKAAEKAGRKAAAKALKRAAKKTAANTSTPTKRHTVKAAAARAARAAQAAWNTASPHARKAAQAAARHGKRAGRALWDGTRAGLVGIAAALWQRNWRVFRPAVRAMWRRIKSKQAAAQTAADTTPAVADTVRRPTNPTTPSTGGTPMSGGGHHFVAPAMELARAAAHYQPQGMLQVGADFAGLEEALRLHAEAMKITVENADATQPLHPNIVELMRQIHGLQLKAAELAAELQPAFRQLHDVDIARLENPRKGLAGERMWDVSTNL